MGVVQKVLAEVVTPLCLSALGSARWSGQNIGKAKETEMSHVKSQQISLINNE